MSMAAYYWGDWYTVLHAVSTFESFVFVIISILLFIAYGLSRSAILRAGLYSGCFENALYSDIGMGELSEVTGYPEFFVKLDLRLLRPLYMKSFSFRKNENGEYIELYSKKIRCSCKNCGADIDKKIYFTGICPYCKTADVFATVITGDKVYSIKSDYKEKHSDRSYYLCRGYVLRLLAYAAVLVLSLSTFLIMSILICDFLSKYNDPEYLKELLLSGESYSSYELIQKEMADTMIWAAFYAVISVPVILLSGKRTALLVFARNFSVILAGARSPFVNIGILATVGSHTPVRIVRRLRKTLQARYLRNCSIEKHGDKLKVAVARRIVKDECPTCGAPIVGAVDENYTCRYCRNKIMKVIVKE